MWEFSWNEDGSIVLIDFIYLLFIVSFIVLDEIFEETENKDDEQGGKEECYLLILTTHLFQFSMKKNCLQPTKITDFKRAGIPRNQKEYQG